jgi:hypothetical protein
LTAQHTSLPWQQAGWLEEANSWINAQVGAHGWQTTGPVEQVHQRPWSFFARVPTDHGTVYFKAPSPSFRFEALLTQRLAQWRPDVTVPLLAVEMEQGWLLSAGAGETLRSLCRTPEQIPHWIRLLPAYAEVQMETARRVPDLLAAGVPDRTLARLPALYAALLEDREALLLGQETGLTEDEHRQLRAGQAVLEEQCVELASYGLPETLAHEELHENNVLVQGDRYTYTDWSDACVGHPFFTMLVTLRSIAHWLKLKEDGAELWQVRDAYLEPWTRFAPRLQLQAALQLAYHLGMINRSLSWHHGLRDAPPAVKADYADSVPGWLQDYLTAREG